MNKKEFQINEKWDIIVKCSKCWIFKPLGAFYKNKRAALGIDYICKECQKQVCSLYYKNNRKKILAQTAKRQKEHPKEMREKRMRRREKKKAKNWIDPRELQWRAKDYIKRNGLRPTKCPICNKTGVIDFHHTNYDAIEKWHIGIFCCRDCHSKIHLWKISNIKTIDLLKT